MSGSGDSQGLGSAADTLVGGLGYLVALSIALVALDTVSNNIH